MPAIIKMSLMRRVAVTIRISEFSILIPTGTDNEISR